ncbi:MAG: aminotransferase class V-fold PLP-dependent enzyme [Candidatus Marinimicrobia bacterium]|nr:aminotransferase class V-fold PLP-dependent enzyme [Candidatus Neomarinimicrobiota bacterium]
MTSNLKNQFILDPNLIFLNHGSFGACPKSVMENLRSWQNRMEKEPVQFFESDIFKLLESSRKALGNFVGCEGDDLVFYPNPTHAVNAVARSLNLKIGDEVLGTNHIYGALDYTWKQVCKNMGAKFIKAELPLLIKSKAEFLDLFFSYVSDKTRVIFISHITSMTAMIFPVEDIIQSAKEKDILTIIDGAHVPGHLPLNITELDPDIYTGACHKWMCAPKGTSFLYVRKNMQNDIMPPVISWGWEGELSKTSLFLNRHEWQGTRDMTPFLVVPEAIKFLNENNWQERSKLNRKLVISARNQFLEFFNVEPICPDDWLGQMATIELPIENPLEFKQSLLEKYNIQIPIISWENFTGLRYSVHFYNSEDDLNKLIAAVKELLH